MNMWQSEANKKQEVPDDPPCDDRNIKILWDEYQQDMKGERFLFFLCWVFPNQIFTYVRTEVNYTEEVDDPIDSDGELNPACNMASNIFIAGALCLNPLVLLVNFCRWGFGFWEFGVQHLWVRPHAAGEQQVQEHSEESPARAHLLHHPVHADHWGPGEETP